MFITICKQSWFRGGALLSLYLHIRFYVRATPLMVANPLFFIYEDCGANAPDGY